jgi:hypothetical protein
MKKTITCAALLLCCLAGYCSADCPKNSDACSAGAKRTTPFLDAVAAAEKKAAAQTTEKPAAATTSSSLSAQERPEKKDQPGGALASPAAAETPAATGALSSPAWLLFVAGLVAGLYFYLGSGLKKRRKK